MSQPAAAVGSARAGHAVHDILIMAGRALRGSVSRKAQPVPQLVLSPLLFFYIFYVVFHRLFDGRGVDYAQFLPPAIVVQSVMWIAVQAALYTVSDRRSGLLARFRSMPVSASESRSKRWIIGRGMATKPAGSRGSPTRARRRLACPRHNR